MGMANEGTMEFEYNINTLSAGQCVKKGALTTVDEEEATGP